MPGDRTICFVLVNQELLHNIEEKTMIKVMIISVGKIFGGIEKYTMDLIEGLNQNEVEIHLVVREDGELRQRIKYKNVVIVKMDKIHLGKTIWTLKRYVKENKIDVVQCNSNNALFAAMLVDDNKKIAVIHGDVEYDQNMKGKIVAGIYKKIEVKLLGHTKQVVAVSNSLKEKLESRGVKRVSVVYNGINILGYNSKVDFNALPFRICCVGNLLEVKNQIVLLKAIKYLNEKFPQDEIIIDIYGAGPCEKNLKAFIDENGLENKVNLMGFCSNVRSKLIDYQLYVQPSKYESLGIATLEAMNAGCCVAVSQIGGLEEIVNEKVGFLFPVDDYVGLACVIHNCYVDRDHMRDLAARGNKRVKDLFSIQNMVLRMQNLYEDVR